MFQKERKYNPNLPSKGKRDPVIMLSHIRSRPPETKIQGLSLVSSQNGHSAAILMLKGIIEQFQRLRSNSKNFTSAELKRLWGTNCPKTKGALRTLRGSVNTHKTDKLGTQKELGKRDLGIGRR